MYQLNPINPDFTRSIKRLTDGACIPMHESNADYQQYLDWLAEGNEPLPADEPAE
jgi:hypothetical protein